MKPVFILVLSLLVLTGCTGETTGPPCICPVATAKVSVACDPCDATTPIEVTIDNYLDNVLVTTICDWRLLGTTDNGVEEVQRLDCAAIYPGLIEIAAHSQGTLNVELEPSILPPSGAYKWFALGVSVDWRDDGNNVPTEFLTGTFDLAP